MAARGVKKDSSRLRRGTSGGSRRGSDSVLEEEDDETEDDYVYINPRVEGRKMIVTFPLQSPVPCVVGNCKVRVKGETKDVAINSFKRHLKEVHKVIIPTGNRVNMCGICHTNIGRMIANHACFRERKMFVNSDEVFPFVCEKCGKGYSNYKGLNNHKVAHKNKEIQQTYNRANGLPVAGDDEAAEISPPVQGGSGTIEDDIVITDNDIERFHEITTGSGLNLRNSLKSGDGCGPSI